MGFFADLFARFFGTEQPQKTITPTVVLPVTPSPSPAFFERKPPLVNPADRVTVNRTSAVNYNIQALGKYWYLDALPQQWPGRQLLTTADSNKDNHLEGLEIMEVNWIDFVDAVIDFQHSQAIKKDGKLGPATLQRLKQHYPQTHPDSHHTPLLKLGSLSILPPQVLTAAPKENIFFGDTALERSIARVWNLYGGAIITAARRYDIPVQVALSVFQVESRSAYDTKTGLMIIRFEPHVFKRYTGKTLTITQRNQQTEWQTLKQAVAIDETAALLSTSYGLPQVMGFNWDQIGYTSVQDMFFSFQQSCVNQVNGFFDFVAKKQLIDTLREQHWTNFVTTYNGPGNVPVYRKKLLDAMRSIDFLEQDGIQFIA